MSKSKASSKRLKTKKHGKNITKKTIPLIHALCKLSDDERHGVIRYLNKEGREAIYECVANCIYNPSIPVPKRAEVRGKLAAKSSVYKYLSKPGNSEVKKKRLIQQRQTGQGIGVILSAVLPLLASYFLNKK